MSHVKNDTPGLSWRDKFAFNNRNTDTRKDRNTDTRKDRNTDTRKDRNTDTRNNKRDISIDKKKEENDLQLKNELLWPSFSGNKIVSDNDSINMWSKFTPLENDDLTK